MTRRSGHTDAQAVRRTARGGDEVSPASPTYSDRVEEILATATRLFHQHGYRGVGIRMIADTVGIQPSSRYHHFSSKEEILYRIALRATTEFIDTHIALLHPDADAAATIRTIVRHHVSYFDRNRLAQQVAERELRELAPDHYDEVRGRQREYLDELTEVVARGSERGELEVENPVIATRAFLDMLNYFNRWFDPRGLVGTEELGDLYADMIVEGLLGARDAGGRSGP